MAHGCCSVSSAPLSMHSKSGVFTKIYSYENAFCVRLSVRLDELTLHQIFSLSLVTADGVDERARRDLLIQDSVKKGMCGFEPAGGKHRPLSTTPMPWFTLSLRQRETNGLHLHREDCAHHILLRHVVLGKEPRQIYGQARAGRHSRPRRTTTAIGLMPS